MIYLCTGCGWRINQRYPNTEGNHLLEEDIGKHLLYKHRAFCSKGCIELAKRYPILLEREVIPSDWEENGIIREWKKDRKINRIRK